MEIKQVKRRKIWRFILLAAVVFAAAGVVYGYCGYKGYILLNHPSRRHYPVRGVDVSHYQGDIDWRAFEGQGIEFAYIKATEGSGMVDDRFPENWDGAREAGIRAGAYHFFSFDSPAQGQFENFVRAVPAYREMLPPTVDFEFYGDKKSNPPDPAATREQLTILLDSLEEQYGVKPVIYAARDTWEMYLNGYFDEYPLWIRSIVTRPRIGGAKWTFWQYANRGRLEGYTGGEKFIDLNVFCGSREEWEEWSGSYGRALDARGPLEEMDGLGLLVPDGYVSRRQGGKLVVTREQSEDSYQMLRLKVSSFPMPEGLGEHPVQRGAWCLKTGMELTTGLPMRARRYLMPDGSSAYRAVDIHSGDWAALQVVWFFFGGGRIYAVEEVCTASDEAVLSFSEMIRQGRVFLDGKTVRLDEENVSGTFWEETVSGERKVLMETVKREAGGIDLRIYGEEGVPSGQPVNTFSFGIEDVSVWMDEDVNFDGNSDLQIMENDVWHIFLWDSKLERVWQERDYGPLLRPERDAVFSLDSVKGLLELRYNDPKGISGSVYGLARWEEDRLLLLRTMELPALNGSGSGRAFPVRVVDFPEGRELDGPIYSADTEGGKALFEEQWTGVEYEEKGETARQVFYGDLAFVSDFKRSMGVDDAFYDRSRIPESLRNYLKNAMKEENEKEALLALRESLELTPIQVKALAAENPSLDRWVQEIAADNISAAAVFVEADGDGDGIRDISMEIYQGGSGGFTRFVFFKGQPDGSFRETSSYNHVKEEFAYIRWEGKPYLVRTSYDYGAKLYDGFFIYAYEDGKRSGAVWLALEPEGFSIETETVLPGYEALAGKIAAEGLSAALDTGEWPYKPRVTRGSGETEVEEGIFSSDVFNTGEPAEYDKYNWYSSNMYTRDGVGSSLLAELSSSQWSDFTGDIVMFWVEAAEDGNVICFLEREGLMDYGVSGWRFNGEQRQKVFRVKWTGVPSVKERALRENRDN